MSANPLTGLSLVRGLNFQFSIALLFGGALLLRTRCEHVNPSCECALMQILNSQSVLRLKAERRLNSHSHCES
jgi:hypothetical protein